MHYASINGHLNVVKELISYGADIEVEDDQHNTPLYYAEQNGHDDIAEYILEEMNHIKPAFVIYPNYNF
jgi:ankyrin repeat protein